MNNYSDTFQWNACTEYEFWFRVLRTKILAIGFVLSLEKLEGRCPCLTHRRRMKRLNVPSTPEKAKTMIMSCGDITSIALPDFPWILINNTLFISFMTTYIGVYVGLQNPTEYRMSDFKAYSHVTLQSINVELNINQYHHFVINQYFDKL